MLFGIYFQILWVGHLDLSKTGHVLIITEVKQWGEGGGLVVLFSLVLYLFEKSHNTNVSNKTTV